MQNYFTLYTLFIKGDTKFWLVVLDKYKKLQPRHKGLTLILKYKSALLYCISLRCEYQIPKRFCFPFQRKVDKFLVNKPFSISFIYHFLFPPAVPLSVTLQNQGWALHRPTSEPQILYPAPPLQKSVCWTWTPRPQLHVVHCDVTLRFSCSFDHPHGPQLTGGVGGCAADGL